MRLFWLLNGSRRGWIKSHLHYRKKPDPDPLKSGSDQFFLTVYTLVTIRLGLWLKSAIVHMRETTVKHGRLTWRRWYGTKIRLLSAFEQQKEAGLVFFPVLEPLPPMAPKPEKSESGSISWKHGKEGLHGKNIWSVPTFLCFLTHFFV